MTQTNQKLAQPILDPIPSRVSESRVLQPPALDGEFPQHVLESVGVANPEERVEKIEGGKGGSEKKQRLPKDVLDELLLVLWR